MKKFQNWFSQLSITIKYLVVVILIIVPIIIGAFFTQSKNDDMNNYGVSYNIVLSERMRTFLLSNYSQQLYYSFDQNDQITYQTTENLLEDQLTIFEDQLSYLVEGNESLGIPIPTDTVILTPLSEAETSIALYIAQIEILIDDPTNETALNYITSHTLQVDQDLYNLALAYEDIYQSGYAQLSTMNAFIIIVTTIIVLFSLFQLRLLRRVEFQAKYDVLTKLRSRSSLFNDIKYLNADNFSIMYIDIYRFKTINDVYGNQLGDEILVDFAKRLSLLTDSKYLYRYGGDEFVILVEGIEEANNMVMMIDQIRMQLTAPYEDKRGRHHHFVITMGLACANIGIDSFEDKLRFAEDLRFDSKSYKQKPMICDSIEEANRRLELERAVLEAIPNDEIVAYFHPLHTNEGVLKGFESLARWHFKDEVITPGKFIPLINSHGLGYELDLKMIELVGKAYPKLLSICGQSPPYVSINIAIDTITHVSAEDLVKALKNTKIPESSIVLEILEDVVIEDQTRKKLQILHDAGYRIALDDFTTGATSFDYLTLDEFNVVKIDQQVIKQIHSNITRKDVLKDLINMIHTSNKDVIIEGIETKADYDIVVELGVDVIQGYYFSKPLTLDQTLEYIKKEKQ